MYQDLLPEFTNGLLVSGDWFMTEPEKLYKVKADFPNALAVDMESTSIAQACYLYHCPLMVIRQISDIVGEAHEQDVYEAFWENAPEEAAHLLLKILDKLSQLS